MFADDMQILEIQLTPMSLQGFSITQVINKLNVCIDDVKK